LGELIAFSRSPTWIKRKGRYGKKGGESSEGGTDSGGTGGGGGKEGGKRKGSNDVRIPLQNP